MNEIVNDANNFYYLFLNTFYYKKYQFDRWNIIHRINIVNIKLKTLTKHRLNVILLLKSTTIHLLLLTSKNIVT